MGASVSRPSLPKDSAVSRRCPGHRGLAISQCPDQVPPVSTAASQTPAWSSGPWKVLVPRGQPRWPDHVAKLTYRGWPCLGLAKLGWKAGVLLPPG